MGDFLGDFFVLLIVMNPVFGSLLSSGEGDDLSLRSLLSRRPFNLTIVLRCRNLPKKRYIPSIRSVSFFFFALELVENGFLRPI